MRSPSRAAAIACAAAALIGFSGNSLLARLALGAGHIDASTFTLVRLVSGAAVLFVIAALTRRPLPLSLSPGWVSAAALFGYAAAFSFAYLELGAGPGALILFGAVQVTMIGWGLATGERPAFLTWFGLALALCGLAALTLPGTRAPERFAASLMALAGLAWGAYSLLGRGNADPIGMTAVNFVLSVPLATGLSAIMRSDFHGSGRGVLLAVVSGALASGVGYCFWYAALPSLTATQAAIAQLIVPVLTAAGAVVLLDETLTLRLVIAGGSIVCGVLLALLASRGRAEPRQS
jgi:drug/metabolite transporter (DMT)-like permease